MRPPYKLGLVLLTLVLSSWGFYAHRKINYFAVFSLPAEMMPFYKKHILYLEEHATDPDRRRYLVEGEDIKHYFDADHWSEKPFDIFPLSYDSAAALYCEDSLRQFGILPWHLQWSYYALVNAFDSLDAKLILKRSADLGHYIADATVPLHTTENYNGQLTNQHGIHAFWESRLPELFFENYETRGGRAKYIHHKPSFFWSIIQSSFAAKDSVLDLEKKVRESLPDVQQFTIEERNGVTVKHASKKFATAYHKALNGMVERRLKLAIHSVASVWFSAWVDAGQPDLSVLAEQDVEAAHFSLKQWFEGKKASYQSRHAHTTEP